MEELTFEEALEELKGIVHRLEQSDIPLERSLELFERGIQLTRICARKLDEVEKKVELLLKDERGELHTKPFTPQDENKDV